MINELIEQFVSELKQEQVYIDYMIAVENLNKHANLLQEYKVTKEQYIKMKPYFKYQDFSELKERFHTLSNKVMDLEEFHTYQKTSTALKERLDELTSIVFKEVLVGVEETTCVSSQENTNEEI